MGKSEKYVDVVKNGREFCYKASEPEKLLCRNCHSAVTEDMTRCPNCNNNLVENSQTLNSQPSGYDYYDNGKSSESNYTHIPSEYTPISMWGYLGYSLLFAIPIAGLIVAIVFSFNCENMNVRNYARYHFLLLIICVVIGLFSYCLGCK